MHHPVDLIFRMDSYSYQTTSRRRSCDSGWSIACRLFPLASCRSRTLKCVQARVALKRISVFLDEEEVSEQTSSLKKDSSTRPSIDSEEDELGFVNASFKWNKVTDAQAIYNMAETTGPLLPTINRPDDGWTTPSDSAALDHQFELRDLNIRFPQGKLTIVMGPTGSGKTALLVR